MTPAPGLPVSPSHNPPYSRSSTEVHRRKSVISASGARMSCSTNAMRVAIVAGFER